MADLSILIPARNEMFLARTIEDILANIEADTEIIAVLDGAWADPPIPQNDRVNVIYLPESIGQRAATNLACKLSKAKYVMKCDAHCAFDKGFDRKMIEAFKETGDNVTMVPIMRNLWAFDWKCYHCGWKKYQGPTPQKCEQCGKNDRLRRKIMWVGKSNPQSTSYCFDSTPHFQYFEDWKHRPQYEKDKREKGLTETMSIQGSCFMLTREKYWELNVCDENFGSWGSQGIEVATKTWLSGGQVLVNHKTWYAHMFRTQGGDFGFPYPISVKDQEKAKSFARNLFFNDSWDKQIHPLSWLVEKFWPVKGWTEEDLEKLKANTFKFADKTEVLPAATEVEPAEEVSQQVAEPAQSIADTEEAVDENTNDLPEVELILEDTQISAETEALIEQFLENGIDSLPEEKTYPVLETTNYTNGLSKTDLVENKSVISLEKVTIIGNSWIGKSMAQLFPKAYIYDPKGTGSKSKRKVNAADVAFICIPTSNTEGKLDTSQIEEYVAWCECPMIVIRSTINPGTADYLSQKYKKRLVVQPEYLGEYNSDPFLDETKVPFIIIGGNPQDRRALIDLYATVYNANIKIRQVTAYEAEVIKLCENRAIYFKIAQCQELYEVCEKAGIDYYTVRDAVYGDDPRFNLWWTLVDPNKQAFNSENISKYVYAWCAWAESLGYKPEITKSILERNKELISAVTINKKMVKDNERALFRLTNQK